ncbi:MAG: 16S rRNA (cytosine(1402)-N(4))-methyltransferase RsmH [Myxococcota bacterium]
MTQTPDPSKTPPQLNPLATQEQPPEHEHTSTIEHVHASSSQDAHDAWHVPVLLERTLACWSATGGTRFVDGTCGGGGHSFALLSKHPDIQLLGLDRDTDALHQATQRLAPYQDRCTLRQGSYANLGAHLNAIGWSKVDGILLDLGVSSYQLDTDARGFSFLREGPLDMRFDQQNEQQQTAADLLASASEQELIEIFRRWGEEPQAKKIARHVVQARIEQPWHTTTQLADALERWIGRPFTPKKKHRPKRRIHPATRCFQALRIAVNQELQHLQRFLEHFPTWLATGGCLAVLSFHSLEDRMVKRRLRALATGTDDPNVPLMDRAAPTFALLHRKPLTGTEQEIEENPRARSALLRAARKL